MVRRRTQTAPGNPPRLNPPPQIRQIRQIRQIHPIGPITRAHQPPLSGLAFDQIGKGQNSDEQKSKGENKSPEHAVR
jgi:hypothetical protein